MSRSLVSPGQSRRNRVDHGGECTRTELIVLPVSLVTHRAACPIETSPRLPIALLAVRIRESGGIPGGINVKEKR
jgi:hypothetical protein